jgi:UDP-N-acetyl-D-galactosamine dehydrogenase
VAEAAKVVENTQRDVNIAFMNDLSMALDHLGIDTHAVLAAAGTKWNFLPFTPGFVGGHCIGVDPYYLAYKSEKMGHRPELILAARRTNDQMGPYVADKTVLLLAQQGIVLKGARVAVFGVTFKENVSDLRNSRVMDLVRALRTYGVDVGIVDPHATTESTQREYGETLINDLAAGTCDAVVLAVPHAKFTARPLAWYLQQCRAGQPPILIDVKRVFPRVDAEAAGAVYWGL